MKIYEAGSAFSFEPGAGYSKYFLRREAAEEYARSLDLPSWEDLKANASEKQEIRTKYLQQFEDIRARWIAAGLPPFCLSDGPSVGSMIIARLDPSQNDFSEFELAKPFITEWNVTQNIFHSEIRAVETIYEYWFVNEIDVIE